MTKPRPPNPAIVHKAISDTKKQFSNYQWPKRREMPRILAIDPACNETDRNKTGYALYMDETLTEFGTLTKSQVEDHIQVAYFLQLCDHLVIEDQFFGGNALTLKTLVYARDLWIIPAKWHKNIVKVKLYYPADWQKSVTRKWRFGKGSKKDIAAWRQYVKLRWELKDDIPIDAVAAICMLSVYLDELKLNQEK